MLWVKYKIYDSWQVRHFMKFWEIVGVQNVVFFNIKWVSKMGRVRSITILFSDYRRIVFILAEINKAFCGKSFNSEFRSSRNIW